MSLKSAHSPVAHQLRTSTSVNEMQREDFLALAAALRQFNAYEAQCPWSSQLLKQVVTTVKAARVNKTR